MNNNRLKVKFLVRNHYYKICDNRIFYTWTSSSPLYIIIYSYRRPYY